MAYAQTPAEIPDAYVSDATVVTGAGLTQILVQGTVAATETALKSTASGALTNLQELEQAWILSEADGDYGFTYWRAIGPVRIAPTQVFSLRRLKTDPVRVETRAP
jgi:hypothetical protein